MIENPIRPTNGQCPDGTELSQQLEPFIEQGSQPVMTWRQICVPTPGIPPSEGSEGDGGEPSTAVPDIDPIISTTVQTIELTINAAQQFVDGIAEGVAKGIAEKVSTAGECCGNVCGCIEGSIGRHLEDIAGTLRKRDDKIEGLLLSLLGETQARMGNIGFQEFGNMDAFEPQPEGEAFKPIINPLPTSDGENLDGGGVPIERRQQDGEVFQPIKGKPINPCPDAGWLVPNPDGFQPDKARREFFAFLLEPCADKLGPDLFINLLNRAESTADALGFGFGPATQRRPVEGGRDSDVDLPPAIVIPKEPPLVKLITKEPDKEEERINKKSYPKMPMFRPRWNDMGFCAELSEVLKNVRDSDIRTVLYVLDLTERTGQPKTPEYLKPLNFEPRYGVFAAIAGLSTDQPFLEQLANISKIIISLSPTGATLAYLIDLLVARQRGEEKSGKEGGHGKKLSIPLGDLVGNILREGVTLMLPVIKIGVEEQGCMLGTMIVPMIINGLLGMVENWTGFDLADIKQGYTSVINYLCPTNIPSADQAAEAFLGGTLTNAQYRCYVRANNICPEPYDTLTFARRTRPGPNEVIQLLMREHINKDEFDQKMRNLGYLNPREAEEQRKLAIQFPGVSDLIRMMVRDVEDDKLVDLYGMDSDFKQKWKGKLDYWGRAQGLPDDAAKYYWRAHWELPSATQLYEMLHRLRPGRVDASISVDKKIVEDALAANDMLPYWRKRLMAISYAPLTRIDSQRGYFIGVLTQADLEGVYQDLGYDEENAAILGRFARKLKVKSLLASTYVTAFKNRTLSRQETEQELASLGATPDEAREAVDTATTLRGIKDRERIMKAVKSAVFCGDVSIPQAFNQLSAGGLPQEVIPDILAAWQLELNARCKKVPAAKLCKWLQLGLIDSSSYMTKLQNLGYSRADASRMAADCQLDYSEKVRKAREKAIKEEIKRQEKIKREQEKELKRQHDNFMAAVKGIEIEGRLASKDVEALRKAAEAALGIKAEASVKEKATAPETGPSLTADHFEGGPGSPEGFPGVTSIADPARP